MRRLLAAILALSFFLAPGLRGRPGSGGPAQAPEEYHVKAVFVLNFLKFVEWPKAAPGLGADPLVVGILGDDHFEGELEKVVEGKTVQGRKVVIRRLQSTREAGDCHSVFIAFQGRAQAGEALARLEGIPVLTVGESQGFAGQGGMIGMFMEGRKVRFEINHGAARKAGLRVSSNLLKLARKVMGRAAS